MVQPVALQDNLSKAPLAAREQHVQQTAPEVAQQATARQVAQEQILDHSRTRPTEEMEPDENRVYDRERGSQGQGRQESTRGDSAEAAPDHPDEASAPESDEKDMGRHIDVTA